MADPFLGILPTDPYSASAPDARIQTTAKATPSWQASRKNAHAGELMMPIICSST